MVRMQFGYGGAAGMAGMVDGSGSGAVAGAGMGYGGVGMQQGFGIGQAAGFGGMPLVGPSQAACDGFGTTYGLGATTARMAAGLGDVFSFTVAGGAVTAAAVTLPSGTSVDLSVFPGVAYALAGADVLATRTLAGGFSQVRYSDIDADGFYQAVGTARVFTSAPQPEGFGFGGREVLKVTSAGGVVTGVTQVLANGFEWVRHSATIDPPGVEWTLQSGLVVQTQTSWNGATTWEVFRDGNADGRYTEVANGAGQLVDLVGVLAATNAVAGAL